MADTPTPLDAAHAAVAADPGNEAALLRFYDRLADGELYLLLEREAVGDQLEPKIFNLESGPIVLVFDQEERLASFTGGVAPWAALPGRVIAGLLRGQGIGLGVNLDVAPSAMLLPPEAMDWLTDALETAPETALGRPVRFFAPAAPDTLLVALAEKFASAQGLASAALLAGVEYEDAKRGHMLVFIDAHEGAEPALARAVQEALVFSGLDAAAVDVAFLGVGDAVLAAMVPHAQRFDLPAAPQPEAAPPQAAASAAKAAPGMDPAKPPKLRW
ncbi:SseB family protein [Xinfangfangia sp. D13-10-4-6]|uniref:SseB family protein n=1 Tax=Pseudogemmobacter hezensis TaxID=2737662 RepID=UPI001554BA8D|nr:SseB family protein [Pseudogemmobacter hezensis]NPD14530.1 SseB family protein [Pseudogemmobacter hezensis]